MQRHSFHPKQLQNFVQIHLEVLIGYHMQPTSICCTSIDQGLSRPEET